MAGVYRVSGVVMDDTLYFRQLKGGREFAIGDPIATSMDNFVYLIGDKKAGECLVVDPAWDVRGILDIAAGDDMKVIGALITHWHPDHVGGPLFGHDVKGLAEYLALNPSPIYVHKADADMVAMMTGISVSDLTKHDSGYVVRAGDIEVECLHTPGHTAGSQCFRCKNALIAGDTLFLQGCGRLDLPTADVDEMYRTLYERLATLPADIVLYPGHDYGSVPYAPLGEVRQTNAHLRVPNLETWRRLMGG
jgi:glyoxylase-like metal-dependent hydrolase (beta-lactamase superfamily II)